MTHHAGEFRPAVNTFAPRRVTDRQRLPGERLQFFRRELRLGQRESGTLDQRLHQRLVLSALARGTQARLRHRRRQLCLGQLRRQSRTRALHRQQRAPQHLRVRLDRRRGQHPQHVRHRRRQIHARERHDRLALNRRTPSAARQRPQLCNHRRSAQFPQRSQGRRPLRRRGRHITRTTHHHRRQRRQFPRTHERQRRDADRSRRRLQQGRQLRQIPFRFHAAQPRGSDQRAQGRWYRRLVKAVREQGIEQSPLLARTARRADEFNPRTRTVPRQRAVGEQLREHLDRQGRLDCLQSKRELRLSSLKTPRARAHGPEPRRGELVHREPQRVVEKRIHRLVQNRQRQLRGAGRPKFTQRAHRFEPHPGIRIGHQCR